MKDDKAQGTVYMDIGVLQIAGALAASTPALSESRRLKQDGQEGEIDVDRKCVRNA